jgi:hypothetical protein
MPACILIGAGAFVAAYLFMPKGKKDEPPKVLQAPAQASVYDDKEPPAGQGEPGDPATKDAQAASSQAQPPVASTPTPRAIRKVVAVPADVKPDKWGKTPFDVHDITISEDGSRLLTKSEKEVHCVDVARSKVLQTFKPGKPRWDYMKPTAKHIFLSPDAKYVVEFHVSPGTGKRVADDIKEAIVFEAESGRKVGMFILDRELSLHEGSHSVNFTATGQFALVHGGIGRESLGIQAVSTRTATGSTLSLPPGKKINGVYQLILPIPGEPNMIIASQGMRTPKGSGSGLSSIDLRTGEQKAITGISDKPWQLHSERDVELSPDGKLLAASGLEFAQVCDWRANRSVCRITDGMTHFGQIHFTADSKRFVILRRPQYDVIQFGGNDPGRHSVPCTLELFDIGSGNKIAGFTMKNYDIPNRVDAVALSRDGKTIALGSGLNVYLLDFRGAFGIEPLPPAPRPGGSEAPVN